MKKTLSFFLLGVLMMVGVAAVTTGPNSGSGGTTIINNAFPLQANGDANLFSITNLATPNPAITNSAATTGYVDTHGGSGGGGNFSTNGSGDATITGIANIYGEVNLSNRINFYLDGNSAHDTYLGVNPEDLATGRSMTFGNIADPDADVNFSVLGYMFSSLSYSSLDKHGYIATSDPEYTIQSNTRYKYFFIDATTTNMLVTITNADATVVAGFLAPEYTWTRKDNSTNTVTYTSTDGCLFKGGEFGTAGVSSFTLEPGESITLVPDGFDYWVKSYVETPSVSVFYTGSTNLGNLATSLVINIGHTMPSTNYTPAVSFIGGVASVVPSYAALTTTNFTLNLSAGIAGGEPLRWSVIYAP